MRGGNRIVDRQGAHHADGHRLLTDSQMDETRHVPICEQRHQPFLGSANQQHVRVKAEPFGRNIPQIFDYHAIFRPLCVSFDQARLSLVNATYEPSVSSEQALPSHFLLKKGHSSSLDQAVVARLEFFKQRQLLPRCRVRHAATAPPGVRSPIFRLIPVGHWDTKESIHLD